MQNILIFWSLLVFLIAGVSNVGAISTAEREELESRVPTPLTIANFDDNLKDGFHVVEFYSPLCPHCTQLFPDWVKFYELNEKPNENNSNEDNKITPKFKIHQVNCLISGDLCDREGIQYYPMIRFYGAGSKFLGSMTTSHRNVETLTEFANEQLMVWSEDDSSLDSDPNKNEISDIELYRTNTMIDSYELLKTIEGGNTVPRLISFWPTTDDQLNDDTFQSAHNKNEIFSSFEDLYLFRNMWNLAMKGLKKYSADDKLQFNFFNCRSNPEICESLGFKDLTSLNLSPHSSPEVILYLPKTKGGNAIYYKRPLASFSSLQSAVKSLTHWTYRTLVSSELEDLKFKDIKNFIGSKSSLNAKGRISDKTDYSRVAFIQVNDPETQVPEDDALLDKLLQPIADLDTDVYLFKTSDKEEAIRFIRSQEENMINNYFDLNDEDKELEFNETMYQSRTHTTFPMLICIKAGSLYTPVYTSFMSKDMRDYNKVLPFIKKHSLPIINHLTEDSIDYIYPRKFVSNINSKSEKVLISLTDFQPKQYFDVEFFMSYVYHRFTFTRNQHKFIDIEEQRQKKYDTVGKIKDNDGGSDDIIDALRQKIDTSYTSTNNEVYPVYVDIKKFPSIVSRKGWSGINASKYKPGDVILMDRFGGNFWDTDKTGGKLSIDDPTKAVQLLEAISYDRFKGKSLYRWSIFVKIPIYILLTIVAYTGIVNIRKFIKRKQIHVEKMKGLGILGVSPDLEESKFD